MRIALIGAFGQLGTDLQKTLSGELALLGHRDLDITDAESVERELDNLHPQAVVNCAAYNLVDQAEQEPSLAFKVNALGIRNVAAYCGERDIRLMHISTDYVFGQNAQQAVPYRETDAPGPVSAYGVSKLAGEYFAQSLCPQHFVVRTCGLYGWKATRGKGNFIETMLRLGRERDRLTVVNDQRCTPSFTLDVAEALAGLLKTDAFGRYHATNAGEMTWFDLAGFVFEQAGIEIALEPISSETFGAPARRPSYSVLQGQKLATVLGAALPTWQDAVTRYLKGRPAA